MLWYSTKYFKGIKHMRVDHIIWSNNDRLIRSPNRTYKNRLFDLYELRDGKEIRRYPTVML